MKVNLDRNKLSSEYINSKQDFDKVLHHVKAAKPPVWKSYWFYGTTGLASIALIVSVAFYNPEKNVNDNNITLAQEQQHNKKTAAVLFADVKGSKMVSEFKADSNNESKVRADHELINKEPSPSKLQKTSIAAVEETKFQNVTQLEKTAIEVISSEVIETPEKKLNQLPNINGVFYGDIEFNQFCGSEGIKVNSEVEITEFKIQYTSLKGDKTELIKGAKVPSSVCEEIRAYGVDQMLFITQISGVDDLGKKHSYLPMNVTLVLD